MAEYQLLMPEMGESVTDATIIKWLKQEGDKVQEDEDVLEVATDKVDTEIPSPVSGTITKIFFSDDELVEVGKVLATISTDGQGSSEENVVATSESQKKIAEPVQDTPVVESVPEKNDVKDIKIQKDETAIADLSDSNRQLSPLVRKMASDHNLTAAELDSIPGSAANNRLTKNDIESYLASKSQPQGRTATSASAQNQPKAAPIVKAKDGEEIVAMDRMRKLIANHMVMSKQTSPHATLFIEADVTKLFDWRNNAKLAFQEREGEKLTFTPLFIEAVAKAIKDYPGVNVSVSGDNIIFKKDINIGMAAALPSGNLIVPVIRKADTKNLIGLSKEVNDLASRARSSNLKPGETDGGTFTLTNIGTFDNLMGTAIINQPQVAILAIGAIKKKPVVIETPSGDMIGIRKMMYLSFTFDHRVVDGALGGAFLKQVVTNLESWDKNRDI